MQILNAVHSIFDVAVLIKQHQTPCDLDPVTIDDPKIR